MEYAGFIYLWTNKLNGMKYLGSHRGLDNDGYVGNGYAFLAAIKKYGKDGFTREIVEYVADFDNVFLREQYYLDLMDCAKDRSYYNISPSACGGDTGSGHKISAAHKKAFASGARVSWIKGKNLPQKMIDRLSDEWLVTLPDGGKIKLLNMFKFCREHNLNPSSMSAVARGKRAHYKGYKCVKITHKRNIKNDVKEFTYLTKEQKYEITAKAVSAAFRKKYESDPKIIFDGISYGTLVEAKEATGLSRFLLIKDGELLR